MNKIPLSILLTAALLLSATSCAADAAKPRETVTSAETATTAQSEITTRLTDKVPALNFDGAAFRTIQQLQPNDYYFSVPEENGEPVNDAIFRRNRDIEERFNVKIADTVTDNNRNVSATVRNSVLSGSDEYDLVMNQFFKTTQDSLQGCFYNWRGIKYVDLSMPWYTNGITDASVGDYLPMLESDLSLSYVGQTWMMVYNSKLAENNGITGLYKLVDSGEWTVDKLNELSTSVYRDVNGNSERDAEDVFGISGLLDGCMLASFVFAGGARLISLDDKLNIRHEIAGEKTLAVISKLSKLFVSGNGSSGEDVAKSFTNRRAMFTTGNLLFSGAQMADLTTPEMRDFADEFGVLPLPKYDAAQSDYYTSVDGGADILTVPMTCKNADLVGALVEAMSAGSYNDVLPAYIVIALENKGTRNDESQLMIQRILESRRLDFGYLYDGSSGWTMKLADLMKSPDTLVSSIESGKPGVDGYYKGVIDFLKGN